MARFKKLIIPFYRASRSLADLHFNVFLFFAKAPAFFRSYLKQKRNTSFRISLAYAYPCLADDTGATPLDPIYFFQNAWCARKVFETKLDCHYDVGSSAQLVGMLSQYVPTTMVDIRPLTLRLEGLSFIKGSITDLPFEDDSVQSLSSICVIEHIGLGRYGDAFDAFGSERAAAELIRVLARGGNLFISLPVDAESRVYHNAHRAFTREHVLSIFSDLTLAEEKYIYGNAIEKSYQREKGFGTGLFHFVKK